MSDAIAGRYRLDERLGAGGMAEVWLAHDLQLGRSVVLKLLGPGADPERFEREARAIASLSHPNICRLFDYGSEGERPYMVFEHLPGGTLEERFTAEEPMEDAASATIAQEVAAGLAHAHERGIVHRDLKPANVVFDEEGHAKITDFGIARMSGADTLTEEGTLLGTASYMSPEQASGEPATPASDVYAFGVILYRMLGGALPFVATTAVEVLRGHLYELPPPLSAIRPDAPTTLAAIAESSLAKDPAGRPADGGALLDRLLSSGAPTIGEAGAAVTQVLRPPRPSRRSKAPLAALVALPLIAAAGIALAVVATRGESSPPPTPASVTGPPPPHTSTRGTSTEPTTAAATDSTRTATTRSTTRTVPLLPPPGDPPPIEPPPPEPPPPPPDPPPPPEPPPPPTTTAATTTEPLPPPPG
jgi:eukaryotic-like serine/threonine-protein kinase